MTTVVSILLSDIIPLKDRGVWQGLINIVYATGASSGAPLGGLLADFVGWRWAFLGQAPLCLVAFVAVVFALKLPAREQKDWRTNLGRIDFLGALVLVSAVFCLIFGLDRGSNESWSLPISYAPLIASIFAFALFVFVERNIAAEPFAPGHIIFERSLFSCYLCNFFSFGGWLAILYYIPLFFQAVDGFGATGAAVRLIPAILASVSGSLFGGIVMKKTGKFYWLTVVSYATLTTGAVIVLCFVGLVTNSTYGIAIGMMFSGFGIGIGVTSTLIGLRMFWPLPSTAKLTCIVSNAAPEDQAVTTAGSYLFRSLGSVVGVSLSSTVIQQSLRNSLREALGSGKEAEKVVQKVRKSLDAIKTLDPKVAQVVRDCYEHAVTNGFALMVGITFLAVVSSVFIREKRLSR
jgi:predicted MFS family arabinose efflux permease